MAPATSGVFGTPALGGLVFRSARRETAIAEVEAGRRTTPLIGEPAADGSATVTFLARRLGGRAPRIVSDVTGWGEHVDGTFDLTVGAMTRVGRSDWYSLDAHVAPRARIEYLIAYGRTDYRIDPHNPRRLSSPDASELVMPGYVEPEELIGDRVAPSGSVAGVTIESAALHASCRISVYTPAGYRADGDYAVAVFHDGPPRDVPRVLDWLIAHRKIDPIVAVFVEPQLAGSHRPAGPAMRTMLAEELLRWLEPRYALTRSAGRRAILGISYGAKDALDAALAGGHAFGGLGLLIPGRRITGAEIDAIRAHGAPGLRVAILAGQYDSANITTARALRKALTDTGHRVDYTEVPEGHSPRTWLNHLRVVLETLFAPQSQGS